MYGVPEQLNLDPFVGTTLDYIGVGKYQLNFVFSGDPWKEKDRSITVGGCWEIRDAESELIDQASENDDREAYRIHRLLGRTVTAVKTDAPKSFTLEFDNGLRLTVIDDSDRYETCQISMNDSLIII